MSSRRRRVDLHQNHPVQGRRAMELPADRPVREPQAEGLSLRWSAAASPRLTTRLFEDTSRGLARSTSRAAQRREICWANLRGRAAAVDSQGVRDNIRQTASRPIRRDPPFAG